MSNSFILVYRDATDQIVNRIIKPSHCTEPLPFSAMYDQPALEEVLSDRFKVLVFRPHYDMRIDPTIPHFSLTLMPPGKSLIPEDDTADKLLKACETDNGLRDQYLDGLNMLVGPTDMNNPFLFTVSTTVWRHIRHNAIE